MLVHAAPEIMSFLQNQGYIIMFFTMIVEGPIVTYAAAFASSLGLFNIYYVLLLSGFGNIVGDICLFMLGRFGGRAVLRKYFRKSSESLRAQKIQEHMKKHPGKTITLIKLTPLLCVPGLIMTGIMDVPWKKFMFYSVLVSFAYSAFFSIIGFYSGIAVGEIMKYVKFSEWFICGAVVAFILIWLGVRYATKVVAKKIDEI